jgi:ABC-type bacteriocin/lantibiotic exporter with double-glycine peptidase domain
VSFRYAADGPLVLDDVSIEAHAGEYVALVGPSGSGKSTLLRLLLGFDAPDAGAVYYDGQDLAAVDVTGVREQLGVVLQTSRIMAGDVFSNIVGSSPLTVEHAWAAAEMAGLAADIRDMPMGMRTVIPEGGSTLSGGQRQRLLIARALVRQPRIVLFDEATSALDNRTQAIVSRSLEQLRATRIVIAHRLSTVIGADRIFVLAGGRLVQQGTFQELMAEAGPFRELASRQMV